jgi:hypothetical protein
MDATQIGMSIGIVLVSMIASGLVAWKSGDIAAQRVTRKYHEEQADRVRRLALQSLRNEVQRVERLASHNRGLLDKSDGLRRFPVRLPTMAFETALLSTDFDLLGDRQDRVSTQLLNSVIAFLAQADSINSDIKLLFAIAPGVPHRDWSGREIEILKWIQQQSEEIEGVLRTVDEALSEALAK